jgi:hypothetical protein
MICTIEQINTRRMQQMCRTYRCFVVEIIISNVKLLLKEHFQCFIRNIHDKKLEFTKIMSTQNV